MMARNHSRKPKTQTGRYTPPKPRVTPEGVRCRRCKARHTNYNLITKGNKMECRLCGHVTRNPFPRDDWQEA